jgi:organic radical activating enzyme
MKENISKITELPLMEQFYTIQGEGAHQGKAAYFIRVGGCDVGCVWCDVKESWNADEHPKTSIEDITNAANQHPGRIVVVTGGEPLMYDLDELTKSLKAVGLQTHMETSGAYPLTGTWDWICLSPKKFKAPVPAIIEKAHELKIVIYNKHDFKWAETFASEVSPHCQLFLQPEWSREKEMLPLIIEYVKANPQWNISLQVHKYMDIP